MTSWKRRVVSGAVAGALLLPASVAGAQEGDDPVAAAAGYLVSALVDGAYAEAEFDGDRFPDPGLTGDVVLALAAAGRGGDNIEQAVDWLETQTGTYLGEDGEAYAGAHAKLALVVEVAGRDVTDFGGRDLIADLEALEGDDGRYSDSSEFGDFSTGISQSLALLALERAGDGPSDDAVAFLVDAACDDGGVPVELGQDTCTADVDATAFAVQAFIVVGEDDAAGDAAAWLAGEQAADGSFAGGGEEPVVNANSTGLAAQALRVAGQDDAADAAVGWLEDHQQTCDDEVEVAGGIPFTPDDPGDVVRATAQSLPAMAGVGLAEVTAQGAESDAPPFACDGQEAEATPGSDDAEEDGTEAPDEEETDGAEEDDALAGDEVAAEDDGGLPAWLLIVLVALVLAAIGIALARKQRRPEAEVEAGSE